ncbi:MAG TPA: ABC transporter ATP-binding protein [Chloroflexota bacterium]|jgi:branched-chain amino acid transport system ATP-binding protein|nr:ABC transporter ATP-binding protein [Chloroflexota bacterium]
MLEVVGLEARYGDVLALWDASLTVRRGEVVALIGPNGAGKTTLMRAIAGLHRPSAGRVHLDGQPIHALPAHAIVERGVVLVPEGRRLFGGMRVLENLEVGAFTARARRLRAETLRFVFEIFPILEERHGQVAATLSGGQQQMLAIGRALMGLPRLLLLDEPSLGLAPLVVQQIFAVLGRINRAHGVTVLLVEQNARLALELADRAYVLEQGRTVLGGRAADLLGDAQVRQAYLGYAPTAAASAP